MCGIFGAFGVRMDAATLRYTTEQGLLKLRHRGPDDSGLWMPSNAHIGLALGHRRLAIVDLSPSGHQPMTSADGRYTIVFNGEIYNHDELRRELVLSGVNQWRGHSDTETLLAGFVRWGFVSTLRKSVGMFALVVWDSQERVLFMARDRMGEKPLFIGQVAGGVAFASELGALMNWPGNPWRLDTRAMAGYLQLGWFSGSASALAGVRKLPPGHWIRLSFEEARSPTLPASSPYWSLADAAARGAAQPFNGGDEDAVAQLDAVMRRAVADQSLADVPLGAFLSGGVDSSLIVSLMQAQARIPVRTFSIGFDDPAYDEAPFARAIARHLGTAHEELIVSAKDAMNLVPGLGSTFSEPLADMSVLPTLLVCSMARRHVTVALSGDGGDELFAGYNRHRLGPRLWRHAQRWPRPVRRLASAALRSLSPATWDSMAGLMVGGWKADKSTRQLGDKLHKLGLALQADRIEEFYTRLLSPNPESLVLGHAGLEMLDSLDVPLTLDDVSRWLYLDTVHYMRNDVLVKVDRCAMSVSLETRAPFLDHRVVELACSMPLKYKLRDGQSKWLTKKLLSKYVPDSMVDRPKMGFAVPMEAWLRGPLKEWAHDLIRPEKLSQDGLLDPRPISRMWDEHQRGVRNWHGALWCVLALQAWRRNWGV